MITDTIDRMNESKIKSKHPYIKAYWGYYKLWNFKKRFLKKIRII